MSKPLTIIQLPDDVVSLGYIQTKPFHFEQVFYSPSHDFKGTEHDFLKHKLAYEYVQTSPFTRISFSI
jgi:hypothetical protein